MATSTIRTVDADPSIPTRDELLARARALAPLIRKNARQAIQMRRLPDETVDAMNDAGMFRILQPRRWGGYELDLGTFYLVQKELAKADMSAGWIHGVVGVHAWQLAIFDDRAAADVWGEDTSTLIASSYMPTAKLTPVEGGFRASGRWRFSSGCHHAQWYFLGGMLPPDEEGEVRPGTLMFPRKDVTILDTWDVAGLQGTGSHDVVVEDAFIPYYRIHRHIDGFRCSSPGNAVNTGWLYKVPFFQAFLRAVSTASIGALDSMTEHFVEYASGKVSAFGGKTREDPTARLLVARAHSASEEMTALLLHWMDTLRDYAERGEMPSLEERLLAKYQASEVAGRAAQLGTELYRATGGSGLFNEHPFALILSNLNAGRQHVVNQNEIYGANYGAVVMGENNLDLAL
jgi:3-hydroxy-9,10-secoandrosta-1,3,5(10)-triene-9,17-dione monooxygenase